MSIVYIKEKKKQQGKIKKIINKLYVNIKIKDVEENKIYIIPKIDDENREKVLRRVLKKLQKEGRTKIVVEKNLKKYKYIFNKYQIIEGKDILMKNIEKVLEYIFDSIENKEIKLELQDIYFLQNSHCTEQIHMIEYFLEKVKSINIITNNINWYNKLEEDIYKRTGIYITVTNNKRKSLKKAKLIINYDFSKEELSKFCINRNAIIINLTNEKLEQLAGFEGIIINGIEIETKEEVQNYFNEKDLKEYDYIDLYESIFYLKKIEDKLRNSIKNSVNIINLIGTNGKINKKEFNILDKLKKLD